MKNFLKPTKVTWIVFGILLVFMYLPVLVFLDRFPPRDLIEILELGDTVYYLVFPAFVAYALLFNLFNSIGLPIEQNSANFLSTATNTFGLTLILGTQMIILYLIASAASKWYYRRNIPNS